MTAPLWQPSEARIADAKLTAFLARLRQERGLDFKDYDDLYDWSVTDLEGFWTAVWDFCGVIADPERGRAVVDADKMPCARFFPAARLHFAENLLRRRPQDANDVSAEIGRASCRERVCPYVWFSGFVGSCKKHTH